MIRSLNDIDFKQKADSLLLPEDQQKLIPVVKKPGKCLNIDSKIQKIQGLRGISIFVVLFYHIRNDWLPIGYLGVDVFFVISGFLMCHILSKEDKLGRSQILDFYFRRIKRIIPIYLFIILIFLLSAVFIWLHALMFNWVAQKAIKSLLYIANHVTDMNYFALSNGNYKFFVHLWSLSVELQFYLIAPFLILFLSRIPPSAKIVVVGVLAVCSFIYQKNATKEAEHMALSSRIWQFMIGFLAYYLSKHLTTNIKTNETGNSISTIRHKLVDFFFNYGVTFLFILCINVDLTGAKPYNRLILMFCTLICVAYPNSNMLLTNMPLVQLGDISYSVYLIHWFIFEAHHYIHFEYYLYGQKAPCPITLFLITISIVLGYIVENAYNHLSKHLNTWRSLLSYISVAYLMIGVILLNLYLAGSKEQAMFQSENFVYLQNNSYYIDEVVMNIWKNRDTKMWKDADSIEFNNILFLNRKRMFSCPEKSRDSYIPTRYNLDPMQVTTTCYMKGNGTKNIVVLGNSHTSSHFYGIERVFRDTYSNITAIANHQCVFFELDQERSIMDKSKYKSCKVFNDDLFKMLEMWEHRIDIIILGHAFTVQTDTPITSQNISDDKLFQEMQLFYTKLSEFASEVVLVPVGHFESGVAPLVKRLNLQIRNNGSLDAFRVPTSYEFSRWRNYKKRTRAINCPKCVLLDWERFWCDEQKGYCEIIDFKHRLAFFSDMHHLTPLGSLISANYMQKQYFSWQIAKNASTILNSIGA